jgi:hypothetical protein
MLPLYVQQKPALQKRARVAKTGARGIGNLPKYRQGR